MPGRAGPRARAPRDQPLRARALAYLARREHSVAELARKLAPHAQSRQEVDALLAELVAGKLLSEPRFAEVLTRRRGERFGAARVRQELRAHGLPDDLVRQSVAPLAATEVERARALWQRRFEASGADARERARQMRFLAQRGFSMDTIRRVVGGRDDESV